MTCKAYSDGSSESFIYDPAVNLLIAKTDAMGQSTNYSYYLDNNLQAVSYVASGTAQTPG